MSTQEPTFPYAVVEGALAEFFLIRPQGQPALRSRIRHLQRLGLTPSKSGQSKRTQYSKYDIYDLAAALSLADLGVDPKSIIDAGIPNMIRDLDAVGKWTSDRYFVYYPQRFANLRADLTIATLQQIIKGITDKPRMVIVNISHLVKRIDESLS